MNRYTAHSTQHTAHPRNGNEKEVETKGLTWRFREFLLIGLAENTGRMLYTQG